MARRLPTKTWCVIDPSWENPLFFQPWQSRAFVDGWAQGWPHCRVGRVTIQWEPARKKRKR